MTARPGVTNRGRWLAHHIRMAHRDLACDDGCPVCAEEQGLPPDYTRRPTSAVG